VADPREVRVEGILVVDMDGTLYHGDAPVLSYAEHAVAGLAPERAVEVRGRLAAHLDGSGPIPAATDGWEAVAALAAELDLGTDVLDAAFLRSRQALADGTAVVAVPDGLAGLLADLRPTHHLVLATNSPADGLAELLDRIGVRDAFDEVVSSTGKPDGLYPLLRRLLADCGLSDAPWRAFSIGDHWRNDIAPALAMGAMTGYVDRFDRRDGPAHVRAASVPELLPRLREWAADPAAFPGNHPVRLAEPAVATGH